MRWRRGGRGGPGPAGHAAAAAAGSGGFCAARPIPAGEVGWGHALPERNTGSPAGSGFSASAENSAGSYDAPGPDVSRSTAEFRAFASRPGEAESPWSMRAPGRKVALLALVVIVVAVVLAVLAAGGLHS